MGVSFLFLPTDFQALSFTSPRAMGSPLPYISTSQNYLSTCRTSESQNARVSNLTQAS